MLPYFYIGNIQLITFPIIIFLSIVVCLTFYSSSKVYNTIYYASVVRLCVPIFAFAAIGARFVSAITLAMQYDESFLYYLFYGGSVFYGGLLGGMIGLLIICKIKGLLALDYADVYASILPLGHAIARIGCFCNGCCYGKEYEGFLAIWYPINGERIQVFPTWFVEAFFDIILFVGITFVYKKRVSGIRTAIYMIAYSLYRFSIEFIRGDDIRGVFGMFSTSQYISIFLFMIGIYILFSSHRSNMPNYLFNIVEMKGDSNK